MITLIDIDTYTLRAEIEGEVAFLHMDYKLEKFTKGVYEELLIQWDFVLKELKNNGIKVVASFIPDKCEKVKKWQIMFGLVPIYTIGSRLLFRREL